MKPSPSSVELLSPLGTCAPATMLRRLCGAHRVWLLLALLPVAVDAAPRRVLWKDFYGAERREAAPQEVRNFVRALQACGHFSGEVDSTNPPERVAYVRKMLDRHCTGIEDKRRRLAAKYRSNPAVMTVIQQVWDEAGFSN